MAITSIGGLAFDAVLKTDHTSKVTATSHPVESGANISDHAFVEPAEISFEVGVSDCETGNGTFGSGNRSQEAFSELIKLQNSRQLITVVTRFKTYRNMLIINVSVPDDYTTMFALKANILLREIPIVSTGKVTVSERGGDQSQKTGSTNSGTTQATAPKQSILKQASEMLKGA
ncbi:MAG: hypothetical protein NC452_04175 [Eubacterium sp.]|nr:hypothetical protein [Eubacterium sp.]